MFVTGSCQEAGHYAQGSRDASSFRIESDPIDVELRNLGKAADLVLWAHLDEFEVGEHWYEYLVGAASEGAKILGILIPKDYYQVYAGFMEVFEWEDGIALESLYIFPRLRNRGIGTETLRRLEEKWGDRVTVWAGRATAPFYERLGYSRDHSQGGIMLTKGGHAGKTYTQAASAVWR